jgi:PIN domain nuclease of toxin-antitoxin system
MIAELARLDVLRQIPLDERNQLLLSAASSWEMSTKIKDVHGRPLLPGSPASYIPGRLRTTGVAPLQISHNDHNDSFEAASLPFHHSDPIDRLLMSCLRLKVHH